MSIKILLTGKNGQIGTDLAELLSRLGEVVALGRRELDLRNAGNIRRAVQETHPRIIVNAAAYTQVDQAESNRAEAFAVNAEAPGMLAREAANVGAALVHYSTDYVFDGTKKTPYVETDVPNPLSVYGESKLAGERAIQASGAPHLILRTAWVYSTRGRNFLLTILRLSTEREELRIVSDQIGAPTWSREIAAGTVSILERIARRGFTADAFSEFSGIYHITAGGETSWHGFAQAILQERSKTSHVAPWIAAAVAGKPQFARQVIPITTDQYPTPARRPAYSVLSNERLHKTFELRLPDWRTQLQAVFR
jgi:dTDP-4-dehydrorhamnose reductase